MKIRYFSRYFKSYISLEDKYVPFFLIVQLQYFNLSKIFLEIKSYE